MVAIPIIHDAGPAVVCGDVEAGQQGEGEGTIARVEQAAEECHGDVDGRVFLKGCGFSIIWKW